jgi:hypothetical protein
MGETKIHVVRPDQFNLGTAQTPGPASAAKLICLQEGGSNYDPAQPRYLSVNQLR